MTRFEHGTFTIDHAGKTIEIAGLSGWRCGHCGKVEFEASSAQRYAAASDRVGAA